MIAIALKHVPNLGAIRAFADNEMLQILLFAILFGIAAASLKLHDSALMTGLEQLTRVMFGILGIIVRVAPIAALAAMHHVQMGCHGATDLSPVTMGTALHFGLAIPNLGVQEWMPHDALTDEVFPHAYTYRDGYMYPGDVPGHGVGFDEALAAKFPYDPAYLPTARKLDGTVHSW